ncbi:MAG: FAD-dependent oxidoreductase [Bacteriovoracaceae bacterium]|nr:FAD-dependent oxidoreductase [Bacteriovoracaceae bacterium]
MKTDVLIMGTGIAGLTTAMKLAEHGLKVTIVTRETRPEITNTLWAQGGIIYSGDEKIEQQDLVNDIMKASAGTAFLPAAELLAARSGEIVKEILIDKVHTPFAHGDSGELLYTREAAHSRDRIIYNGDMTGRAIQVAMINHLDSKERYPTIEFLTAHTAIDLITPTHHGVDLRQRYEEDKVVGAYLWDQKNQCVHKIMSKFTVLATGGIGGLYLHNSNSEGARGDGHAMAKRAGAYVTNMEFVQFHPTTFYDRSSHRRFLISEALRGEGGKLVNGDGVAFMDKYHPDAELAPRDIVSRAIVDQMIVSKADCVFLDISHKPSEWLKQRFPTIYAHCLERGVDITKSPIPVVPAAHYTCGGLKTDLLGRTNLKGLYAVGEVACTGLHGANRLASTSLLEGLTWGYVAAEDISERVSDTAIYEASRVRGWELGKEEVDLSLVSQDQMTLKQSMWNYVGIIRSKNRLARARAMFRELQDEVGKFYKNAALHDSLIGLRNGIEVAHMVVDASLRNRESMGCFYLKD